MRWCVIRSAKAARVATWAGSAPKFARLVGIVREVVELAPVLVRSASPCWPVRERAVCVRSRDAACYRLFDQGGVMPRRASASRCGRKLSEEGAHTRMLENSEREVDG